MASIQVPDILWNASGFVLSGIVGATIVVIINHFKQRHDQRIQLKNDIYALFCKFFFISSIQYSEYFVRLLLDYFREYMPVVIVKIDNQLAFIKKTQDACDELFTKLGKSRPTKFGSIVEL